MATQQKISPIYTIMPERRFSSTQINVLYDYPLIFIFSVIMFWLKHLLKFMRLRDIFFAYDAFNVH